MSTDERTGLRRFFKQLTATDSELDAEHLQRESAKCGAIPAGECSRGQIVSVSGRLRTVAYTPRTNLPTLEADLYDGSDVVTLVFLGRDGSSPRVAGSRSGTTARSSTTRTTSWRRPGDTRQ
jgi:hypothetical protein